MSFFHNRNPFIYENSVATRKELFFVELGDKVDIQGEVHYNWISDIHQRSYSKKIKNQSITKNWLHDQ